MAQAGISAAVEAPEAGPVAGVQVVRGWAFATEPGETITQVDLVVDGKPTLAIPCCGERADVAASFPQYPLTQTLRSGWGLTLNWSLLPPGAHTVQVTIATDQGAKWTSEPRTVEVVAPGDFEFLDLLSLADASPRLEGEEIILDNVRVRDKASGQERMITLRLRWNEAAQSLVLSDAETIDSVTSLGTTLRRFFRPVWTWLAQANEPAAVQAAAGIHVGWESPTDNQIVSGVGVIRTWLFAEAPDVPITQVQLTLDGDPLTTLPCCSARADVAAAFPDHPNALHSGTALVVNYSDLRAGLHTLTLEIEAGDGSHISLTRTIVVVKPGGFAFLDLFDLSHATVRIDGEELIIENVVVREKASQIERTLTLRFRWDVTAQGFLLAANDPPVAFDQHLRTFLEVPAQLQLQATDHDGDFLRFAIATGPQHGRLQGEAPFLTYIPNPGFLGEDSFTFQAYDATSASLPATVTILVERRSSQPPPPANASPVLDLDPTNSAGQRPNFTVLFPQSSPPLAVTAPTATLTDPDSATLTSLIVTLINLVDSGQEILAADTTGTSLTATYDTATTPGQGMLTLTGPDTVAHFQQVLRRITYQNTSTTPTLTPRQLTFIAQDETSVTSTSVLTTITVAMVNQAPSFTKGAEQTVLEDAGAQTVSGWATNIEDGDPNVTQTLTFSIVGNTNPSLFSAGPTISSTGTLSYTPAANANGSATITVTLKDNGGTANGGKDTSTPQSFTITVTPVNDVPSFTVGPNQTVNENAGPQTVNPWATAISAGPANESGQTLTFQVTNNANAALFSAGPSISAAGVLTYTPVPNANGSTTITLVLKDDGGTANGGVDTSAPQTFTITVVAVDNPPVAVNDTATVTEDGPATTINVLANDTDVDGGPKSIASVTQPTNGTVVITNGGANLTYQPAPDYCNTSPGATLDTFTYTLAPGGSTAMVSVTVTCVNDAPVVDLNGPVAGVDFAATFTKGTPAVIVDAASLTVSDADNATLASATITITNLQDVGKETLIATTAGTAITAIYVEPTLTLTGSDTLAHYQQVLRTVTYNNTSQPPNTTARLITFIVNDGALNSAVATSTVTVININSAPSFAKGPDQTVLEDAGAQTVNPWATVISDGDGNTQTLTFQVTGNTNPGLFSAGPVVSSTGVLTYTPAPNANGTATITLVLKDNGGTANGGVDTSAPQTATITVTAVNDAPSFTSGGNQTVNEDAGPQTVNPWATAVSPGPADESGQTLTFNITGNTNTALFSAGPSISATGVLTYTPAANASGSATITVQLQDNGGTANGGVDTSAAQTFTITVNPVNDAPSFTKGPDQTVNEDAGLQTINGWAIGISAGPANESGQTLAFNVTSNTNPSLFSAGPAVSSTGVLTYTPADNANGVATITLVLQDNGGTANGGIDTSAAQMFTITVNPVNDPPSVTPPAAYAAQANIEISVPSGANDLLNGSTITDVDGSGASPFSLTAGMVTSTNSSSANVTINADGSFTYDPPAGFTGSDTFLYQICDSGVPGSACTNATVTVTVSGPRVWFVNNALGAAGDGRLSSPFNTLAAADTAANTTGDRIFVFTGSGTYTGGFSLLTNQFLVGQGVVDTDFDTALSITPPTTSVARPSINGARPTITGTLNLATGITARGFNINNTTAAGVTGSGTTGLSINQVSVTTTTGVAVNLTNSGGTVSFTSISANGATNGIVLSNTTGSFIVTGDGTLSRNGSGGTITATSSHAISLTNANNVTLRSMTLSNTGGTGTAVQSTGGSNIVLSAVEVNNPASHGWEATDIGGSNRIDNNSLFTALGTASTAAVRLRNTNTNGNLTIDNSSFTNQGASNSNTYVTVQSLGSSNINFTVTNNSQFTGLLGDAILSAAGEQPGSTGTVTTIIEDSSFLNAAANGSGAIAMTVSQPGATQNFTVQGNAFSNLSKTLAAPVGIITANCANGGGTLSGTISTNVIDLNSGTRRGIQVVGQTTSPATLVGTVNVTIDDNDIDRIPGNFAIVTDVDDGIGSSVINITNNRIGQNASFLGQIGDSFDGAVLMRVRGTPASDVTMTVQNNNIRANTNLDSSSLNDGFGRVMWIDARNSRTARFDILNNTIRNDDANSLDPEFYNQALNVANLCMNLNGNNAISSTGSDGSGDFDLNVGSGTVQVQSLATVTADNEGTFAIDAGITNSTNCVP